MKQIVYMGKRWLKYGKYIMRKGKMFAEIWKTILQIKGKCLLKYRKLYYQ